MVWPSWIKEGEKPACLSQLEKLQVEARQNLLDELAGQQEGQVKNPVTWLMSLAELEASGNLKLNFANKVREARVARLADQKRQAGLGVQGPGQMHPGLLDLAGQTEATRAVRARLVERRRGWGQK